MAAAEGRGETQMPLRPPRGGVFPTAPAEAGGNVSPAAHRRLPRVHERGGNGAVQSSGFRSVTIDRD